MDVVVFLHGIWMKSIVMQPMAVRFRKSGFQTHCFSYPSLQKTPEQNARLFSQYVQSLTADKIHFVAHSLGGIVLMHYFHLFDEIRPGRVVMLGSPIGGSSYAIKINKLPGIRRVLGGTVEQGLLGDIPVWASKRQLGMIAGNKSVGVGSLLGRSREANDGAVTVAETRIPELTDHIVMSVSHSGMLMSGDVASQAIHFLRNGYFLLKPS